MITLLLTLLLLAIIFGFSWAVTCGILWLAAWCFGLVFDLKIATGVWLILLLVKSLFKEASSSDKEDK